MDTCQNVLIQQQNEMVFVIGIFILSILNYNLTNFQVAILDNNSVNLTYGSLICFGINDKPKH
jgi:hypothetical protein